MARVKPLQSSLLENGAVKQWISRAFIVSILVYLVVIGYLVAEAVMGASKWAPYGVNIPAFIALIIASEIAIVVTAVWIFREDAGIWPETISEGWTELRGGSVWPGAKKIAGGAWDVSIVDLRLRTPRAIYLGRLNRVAALAPLVYALAASASGAPWGLRASALVDIGLTLAVWAFMEIVMVRPEGAAQAATVAEAGVALPAQRAPTEQRQAAAIGAVGKQSHHQVRRVQLEDIERILTIERIRWREQAATRDMILSRLQSFPEGQFAAIHVTTNNAEPARQTLAAWATVMPAGENALRASTSWDEVTSRGTIQNFDRDGNALVGVNLTSVTEGATYILLGEILASVVEWEKKKLIGGSRLNGFIGFNERRVSEGKAEFTADQYAHLREIRGFRCNEERIDAGLDPLSDDSYRKLADELQLKRNLGTMSEEDAPDYVCSNLRGYMSIPGTRMISVIENYFADAASADYGVLIEWPNPLPAPLRRIGVAKRWVASRVRSAVLAELDERQRVLHERSLRRRSAQQQIPEFLRRDSSEAAAPAEGASESEIEMPVS